MSKKRLGKKQENFVWLSYADLSTGLMIVFILIFLSIISNDKTSAANQDLAKDSYDGINKRIIEIVKKSKECSGMNPRIRPGYPDTIQFGNWFAEGEYKLKPAAYKCLRFFAAKWIGAMYLSSKKKDIKIRNLIIEGHTNSIGGYLSNLQLSQQRALTTSVVIFKKTDFSSINGDSFKMWVEDKLDASGRSESDLMFNLSKKGKRKKVKKWQCSRAKIGTNIVRKGYCVEDQRNSKRIEFKYIIES